MLDLSTIALRKLSRKLLVSASLIAVVGLAVASKGGGDKTKANMPLKTNFVPIRTTTGFTLKAGPTLTGSTILATEKTREYISFNTLITYQHGNMTYIMPRTFKINSNVYLRNSSGSNLSLLDLRINMH